MNAGIGRLALCDGCCWWRQCVGTVRLVRCCVVLQREMCLLDCLLLMVVLRRMHYASERLTTGICLPVACSAVPLWRARLPMRSSAASATFTARHDRLLRSVSQCPVCRPTVQADSRHHPDASNPDGHALLANESRIRCRYRYTPVVYLQLSALRVLVFRDIDHIRHFLLLLHGVTACRIACG